MRERGRRVGNENEKGAEWKEQRGAGAHVQRRRVGGGELGTEEEVWLMGKEGLAEWNGSFYATVKVLAHWYFLKLCKQLVMLMNHSQQLASSGNCK